MILVVVAALAPHLVVSEAPAGRFDAGGYFRVMTRPDFQGGGDGRLGYWNLYGRLLNEGPYAALELRYDVLPVEPATTAVWSSVHAKIEGGSVMNADAGRGNLSRFALTQLYLKTGNLLLADVTWQLGTLDTYFGDLGLYDMKPAQIFFDTLGLSARYQRGDVDVLLGMGDAGWFLRGEGYNTVATAGGTVRYTVGRSLELGAGGQYWYEPSVRGSPNAPYQTPGISYEDFVRREVTLNFFQGANDVLTRLPDPLVRDATSFKLVGYLGFGALGPLRWNSLYANYLRRHPDSWYSEPRAACAEPGFEAGRCRVFVRDFTDERYQVNVGNEMQITIIPERLDVAWAALYGWHEDRDNDIAASDDDRTYWSTVLRTQTYLTPTLHLLVESSLANERSHNGNSFREHWDSIEASSGGAPDARGLERGDTDRRTTWQIKAGFVLNPVGLGIYTRPSLRILYGGQYSNVHNAYSDTIAETREQSAFFSEQRDRHWHHVVALEAEAWF